MKKIILIFSILKIAIAMSSQPWLVNLPKEKSSGNLTLKDYQKAFYEFWAPFNVQNGYYLNTKKEKVKATGWKQFKRWEWFMESIVNNSTGEFPNASLLNESKNYLLKHTLKSTSSNWTNLGTNSSLGGYAGIGRINCVAFHPDNNNVFWVGTPSGGLWMTNDNGITWQVLNDDNLVIGVSDIVVPSDYAVGNEIYIATGDRDAWDNRSIGVLKSTDGGQNWSQTNLSYSLADGKLVTRLLLSPKSNQTIIAATTDGVFKTSDGGINWTTKLSNESFVDMELKPGSEDTLYGSTRNGSVFVSYNGGLDWVKTLNTMQGRVELAVSPDDSARVYAIVANPDNGLFGIYNSTDFGTTFIKKFDGMLEGNNLLGYSKNGSSTGGQAWYDITIAASPLDADIIIIGGINTWRSINGGTNWSIVNHWTGDGAPAVHADKHMHAFKKNGHLIECNDGGIYISTNLGTTWTDRTNGIVNSQIYRLGLSKTNPLEIITGLQDNGTKITSNNTWYDVKGGDGMECLIDYTDINVQYGTYVNGQISRTLNHWGTSQNIQPDGTEGAWITPYIIDPKNNKTLYAGYSDIWKTENQGDNWQKVSVMNSSEKIRAMAIAPSNNQILYVAEKSNIWRSLNGAKSWQLITSNLPVSANAISYIAVKSDDPFTLWVSFSGFNNKKIFESNDAGETWIDISSGLPDVPIYSIVHNKLLTNSTDLYAGTYIGVFYKHASDDWIFYNSGLPNVIATELEIYYDSINVSNSRIRAATYGRGLWESPLQETGNFAPSTSTETITNISAEEATLNGRITESYGSEVFESGFVYSKFINPKIDGNEVIKVMTNPLINSGTYTANITGLTNETEYYVRSYAINSNGTGYGSSRAFKTTGTCTIPTMQAMDFEPINVGVNDATLNYSRGNGDKILILAKKSSPVDTIPQDHTNYRANPSFGLGDEIGTGNFVVYNGYSSNVYINNLSSEMDYYFEIFEYNTSNNCYLTPGLKGSFVTCKTITTVVKQPMDISTSLGSHASFKFEVTGSDLEFQWQKDNVDITDNSRISGSKTDLLEITAIEQSDAGEYRCRLKSPCDSIVSENATLSYTSTGLVDPMRLLVELYPNPAQNKIFIKADQIKTISVYSLSGHLEIRKTINSNEANLDISKLKSGTYIIEVKSDKGIFKDKIIIK
ncbi:MAG: T9SS type A sorting domain-containing protein [Bacteroidales bacterium]